MHRIVKAHLESFVKSFGIENLEEDVQFELFCNKALLSSRISMDFEIDDVTSGSGDDGMDGVAIIIDEELCISPEDATSVYSSQRKNHDVDIVFIQSKRSESFDLGDFLKFKESIFRFVEETPYSSADDIQKNARDIFDVVIKNVPKIRGGRPTFTARYVATGIYKKPKELELARIAFINEIDELGYFCDISVEFVDRDELTRTWIDTYSVVNAELPLFSNAALPKINGIEEAYLAVVKAKDFVDSLLVTEEGSLRNHVFVENVRAFLGIDNPVNASIAETIKNKDSASRFPVLNNGITIVSPDVKLQGNILHLESFQIVNGCQTSNVLYECRNSLDDSMMVNLKVVETSNEDVFSELVRATNSQTKVDETQFYSLRPIIKKVEAYFDTYEGQDGRLFLERRERQFIGRDIPAVRVFSVHMAAKCVAAMFFRRPDLSYRYPKRMYELLAEKIFSNDSKEIIFYAACLTLYRLHLLTSNADIPQNIRKYKWHLMAVVGALIAGKEIPKLGSKRMDTYCGKIITEMTIHGDKIKTTFQKAVEIVLSIEGITDDRMKRQVILEEMLAKI
ncbi:AIPR family protein [Dickeya dadantii]|uniref:AIPR family protein n=1 Tax=Dickeya dadantii TaxID=204038 RepID=UPI0013731EC4|nr:AIPR family protein [Dickeya dadantii]NAT78510.1 AIPR family protein [Dickeya dadantii]